MSEGSEAMSSRAREDRVARRMRFSEAHPEVTFAFDRDCGQWNASWPGTGSSAQAISCAELRDLLDRLEKILG